MPPIVLGAPFKRDLGNFDMSILAEIMLTGLWRNILWRPK